MPTSSVGISVACWSEAVGAMAFRGFYPRRRSVQYRNILSGGLASIFLVWVGELSGEGGVAG
jgi:hypothetical protein